MLLVIIVVGEAFKADRSLVFVIERGKSVPDKGSDLLRDGVFDIF